ncbi:hypothetical protein ACCT08_14205, partial [Rhizobium johnstonii]
QRCQYPACDRSRNWPRHRNLPFGQRQSDPVGQYIKLYFFLFRKIQAPKAAPAPGDLVSAVI